MTVMEFKNQSKGEIIMDNEDATRDKAHELSAVKKPTWFKS